MRLINSSLEQTMREIRASPTSRNRCRFFFPTQDGINKRAEPHWSQSPRNDASKSPVVSCVAEALLVSSSSKCMLWQCIVKRLGNMQSASRVAVKTIGLIRKCLPCGTRCFPLNEAEFQSSAFPPRARNRCLELSLVSFLKHRRLFLLSQEPSDLKDAFH
jgi:hypothetical protein